MLIFFVKKAIFCLPLIIILSVFISSCILEPNYPQNNVVLHLLNNDGLNYSVENYDQISVKIPDTKPVVYADGFGFCYLGSQQTPYDLDIYVYHFNPHTFDIRNYLFKGLANTNPVLVLNPSILPGISSTCILKVKVPVVGLDRLGIIKFISKDIFHQRYNEYIIRAGDSTAEIEVDFHVDNSSIMGRLLYLECTGTWGYEINLQSYEKFGWKDVTLNNGSITSATFTSEDVQFNPGESTVNFNIAYPSGAQYKFDQIKLNFDGYNGSSLMTIGYAYNRETGSCIVPLLNVPYNIRVSSSFYQYFVEYSYPPFKSIDIPPGGSGNILHGTVELLNPPDNAENIMDNTCLVADHNNENSIYIFYISTLNEFNGIRIITDKNSLRLNEIKSRDFKIYPDDDYQWYVVRISGFNSINEFTEMPYLFNLKFTACYNSPRRHFITSSNYPYPDSK